MACVEVVELENIWQKRFERANAAASGVFAVGSIANVPTLRHLRAKQAQAAHAILTHRAQCQVCNRGEQLEPFMWLESVAS